MIPYLTVRLSVNNSSDNVCKLCMGRLPICNSFFQGLFAIHVLHLFHCPNVPKLFHCFNNQPINFIPPLLNILSIYHPFSPLDF